MLGGAEYASFLAAQALFNRGDCFEAHELLEALWMRAEGDEKPFLQGLIQLCVACHHWQRGNLRGAEGVYARARRNLSQDFTGHLRGGTELLSALTEDLLKTAAGAEKASPPLQLDLKMRSV